MSKRTGTEREAGHARAKAGCIWGLERPVRELEAGLAVTVIVQCPGRASLDDVLARLLKRRDSVAGPSVEDAAWQETPAARPEQRAADVRDAPQSPPTGSAGPAATRRRGRAAPRTVPPKGSRVAPAAAVRPFDGGELVFYPDRLELCGVRILGDTGLGHSRRMLELLRRKRSDGKFVRMSGEELARKLGEDVDAAITIGTVTGCARTLRENITRRLRRQLNIACDDQDVLAHDDQGWRRGSASVPGRPSGTSRSL